MTEAFQIFMSYFPESVAPPIFYEEGTKTVRALFRKTFDKPKEGCKCPYLPEEYKKPTPLMSVLRAAVHYAARRAVADIDKAKIIIVINGSDHVVTESDRDLEAQVCCVINACLTPDQQRYLDALNGI